MGRSLVDVALGCYPRWWTERYGDEMRAVIDDLKAKVDRNEGSPRARYATRCVRDCELEGCRAPTGCSRIERRTSVAAGTVPWLAIVPFVLTHHWALRCSIRFRRELIGRLPFRPHAVSNQVARGGAHGAPGDSAATWVVGISVDGRGSVCSTHVDHLGRSDSAHCVTGSSVRRAESPLDVSRLTWAPFAHRRSDSSG